MNLNLDTTFNPLTYDELIKPIIAYGKAYKEVEDAYSTLAEQSESFKDEVNKDVNREAFELYNKYSTDLNAAIEDFSKGMTSTNRRKLLEMKRRYAGEIVPIAKASIALKEANAFRDKAGPDAIFEIDRYNSLDDFLHGKVANNKYTTISQIASRAKEKAEAVAATTYNTLINNGVSPQKALAIMQDPNSQAFKGIYDSELEAVGADNYDDNGKSKINNAISTGINSALDKLVEREVMTAAQRDASARAWAQLRLNQEKYEIELLEKGYTKDAKGNWVKKGKPEYTAIDLRGNPYNLDAVNELYGSKEDHDKYAKFFDKDGNLTKEGLETYKDKQTVQTSANITGTAGPTITLVNDFTKFINKLTGKQNPTKEEIEKAYKENAKRFESITNLNADVIRNTAFHVAFRDSSHIKEIMKNVPNSKKLDTYKYTKDGYKKVGSINIHDDKFKDATYSGEYGSKGNFVVITTTDGEKYKVPLKAVHQALDASIQSTFNDVKDFYLKNENGTSIPYTEEELYKLIPSEGNSYTTRNDLIKKRLNSALDNYVAAFEEMQTEPYKVTGGLH